MDLLVLTAGPFGLAVAEALTRRHPTMASMPLTQFVKATDGAVPRPSFVGVAAWRRYPDQLDLLDQWSWTASVPWSTVVLEGPVLRAGPLVAPARSPCHRCFRARWLSNSAADRELALEAALAKDLAHGSHGFTPSLVSIAAALLSYDFQEAETAPGRTRWFDLRNATVTEETVIRVHGCARCGPARVPGSRYTDHLLNAIAETEPE